MTYAVPSRPPMGPKQRNAVVPALRQSARGERCTLRLACCNNDPETTVLAHIRKFGWAGVAEKPPDYLAVFACSACHDAFDRGGEWGWEDVLRALGETLQRHYATGRLRFGK